MRTLAALSVLLFLPACSLLGLDDAVPFADVPNAEMLRLPEPGTSVFNDAASWEAFWYDHTTVSDGEGNPVPPPEIDFSSKTAVAVFLGGGPSGCTNYLRLVRSVSLGDDATVVRVEQPRTVERTCDMLINPIQVVAFEKAGVVRFAGDVPG
ncbi:hypothetical protein [Rubrivirga sp.]|uniref:hypothetical protein n=1 Tax=Rubrivirga sp. TaxID=1885344 RepID=UPI003C775FEB